MGLAQQQERQEVDLAAAPGDPETPLGMALGIGEASEECLRPSQSAQWFTQRRQVVVGQPVQ